MRKTSDRIYKILSWIAILVVLLVVGIGIFSVRYVLVPKSVEQSTEKDTLITADDGIKLVASESIAPEATHKWAILVHSYRTSRSFMEPYAKKYQEKGYNTLIPDNRAHGASGGKYIGMGYLDQYVNIPDDIPSAVRRYGNHFLASLLCIPNHNFYENISKGCYAPQIRQGLD